VPLPRSGVSINRQLQQLLRHVRLVREEVEACADPLAVLPAPANRRDDGLLAATLDALGVVDPLPQRPTVHLDAGYDWTPCREVLAERGMVSQIATRGVPASIQVGRRWVIERTHAWATRTASCAGAPSAAGWWWILVGAGQRRHRLRPAASARLELLPLAGPTPPSALTPPGAGP
jgi:hypothetical protein